MDLPSDIKHLYLTWLEEAIVKFSVRQHKSGMLYSKAIDSLKEYEPAVLNPLDLKKVKFFGPKLIDHMSRLLKEYCSENGYRLPFKTSQPIKKKRTSSNTTNKDDDDDNDENEPKKKKTTRAYIPKKGSGGYAIMLVLLENDRGNEGLTKDSITNKASKYCTSSFTKNPAAMQMYSAWDSIKSLMKHELVKKQGNPPRYFLTDEGETLANNLKKEGGIKFMNDVDSQFEEPIRQIIEQRTYKIPQNRKIYEYENINYHFWEPKSFEVIFIVDNREIRAKDQRDYFANKLQQYGVNVESRVLTVGDGLWIARNKETKEEVVLDYIIERKRLDDLASSIKDGRYNEQKIRLKRTGITNVFYVVEEVFASDLTSMAEAMKTSMSLALTNSKFHLERTKDADDTIQFIKKLTEQLEIYYKNIKLLVLDPLDLEFQQDYKKTLNLFSLNFNTDLIKCVHKYHTFDTMLSKTNLMTTREMFVRMLMTIRGISLEKASAIQKEFKTPRYLIENFEPNDDEFASKYGKKIQENIYEMFQK